MLVVSPLISSVPCCQLSLSARRARVKAPPVLPAQMPVAGKLSLALPLQTLLTNLWRSSKRGFVICKLRASCCSPEAKRRLRELRRCLSDAVLAFPDGQQQRRNEHQQPETKKSVRRCCRQGKKLIGGFISTPSKRQPQRDGKVSTWRR